MDLEQLEALALADDRAAALAGLLPGTPEHDYWRGVHHQHRGELDAVDALLAGWRRRHGRTEALHDRLARRQLLLRAGRDIAAHADRLRFEAGVRLDDQAEAVAAAQRHPTRLDQAIVDGPALVAEALRRAQDLSHVTDWAITDLLGAELDAARRRHLLQRLTRADHPGLVALIAADLAEKSSRGFGSLPIHARLTAAQIEQLADLAPELRKSPAWVAAALTRMRPPAHVDWQHDAAARAAYLDALWAFADGLAPAFNGLRAQILYHQLDLDRRAGRHDRARLLRYLALPRMVSYAQRDRLARVPAEHQINLGADPAPATGLGPVPDDEALVGEHLDHFLRDDDGDDFADHVRADWLDQRRAAARLLAGAPEPERWAAVLGPTRLAALRDRVDLDLTAGNPARVAADADVALEVDVKNVPQLVVKTYRIDAVAHFLARGAAVDTAIDLDGMVASDEQILRSDLPPVRRERRRIALPGCARPGTYVVELIGGGKASRALIHKGGLRYTLRVGVAGPTLRVLDDAGRPADGARVWLGGREYAPRDDGAITIPFSTAAGTARMLLVHGDVAQLELLDHPEERYHFSAGIHLERESLVPGRSARALLRPRLTCAGWPATVALLKDPRVELAVTDRLGTTASRTLPVTLRDDAETALDFHVPEDTATISLSVRAQVRNVSRQRTQDLSDSRSDSIGAIHDSPRTDLLFLATTAAGHALHLLGKTGEPKPGRPVTVALKHAAVTFEVTTTLETDDAGRVDLGPLVDVVSVSARLPGLQQTWWIGPEEDTAPHVYHVSEGTALRIPRPAGVPADAPRGAAALLELRGGAPARDVGASLSATAHALVVAGDLPAGEYLLQARGAADTRIVVAPAGAPVTDGWVAAGPTSLELSPALPLIAEIAADDDHLTVRVDDAGPHTRVHLVATRFRHALTMSSSLREAPRAPLVGAAPPVLSHYVSGRDIGDEYRYVLERRGQPRRPGVLLDKPGLLLNPWAVRTTTTGVQHARAGAMLGGSPARPAAAAAPGESTYRTRIASAVDLEALPAFDFLPTPAVVIANLRPDDDGRISVPRGDLGDAQSVRVLVVDPALTSAADLALPPTELHPRDLRLRLALAHDGHFREDRTVEAAPAGARLVVDDVRAGKLELLDTTARAHQSLLSLGAPDTLREFDFVARWHALDDATRRARYSKYACHELHLFLYFRDPEFFARVVRPYLAHKRHRTFVDRWLLDDDLTAYLDPFALGRLNALELALLARRVPAVAPAIARLLGDRVDLIPPDPERDARLVDTLLGATALEGGGAAAAAAASLELADEAPKKMKERARKRARVREEEKFSVADDDDADGEASEVSLDESEAPPPPVGRAAAPAARALRKGDARGGGGGDFDGAVLAADLRERRQAAPLYRGADRTQEWAESDWWHVRAADAGPDLIPVNRFWRDFARHDPAAGPFLSPHLGECAASFPAAMAALAALDLPFVAAAHDVVVEDARLTLTCGSNALAARTRIAAAEPGDGRSQLLVGQNYFREGDRWEWDGAERREKYVDGELLTGVAYQCQVVVTNPTSRPQKLSLLLQIPKGAMPVSSGFFTRTLHWYLAPYATQSIEYAFYFPRPGESPHFPAHVSRGADLLASAAPRVLAVVDTPTTVDAGSWAHVSQHGSLDDVLAFLARANLGRVDLDKIAWRMKQPDAFARVLALLAERRVYSDRLWAYALMHADRARIAEWLRHQDGFLRPAGPALAGAIVDLDPIDRRWYEHLEYAPLINARAHQLGARRQILNDALAGQYRSFLDVVAHRPAAGPDDLLAAAHYLLSLDRVDDALAALARVDPAQLAARLQYDHLAAYAACCRGDLAAARALATPWADHPVDRWRSRFAALLAMIDEAEGRGPAAAVDADSRDQRMNELAARQPALSLAAERDVVVVQHANLERCELRLYRMDIELLFSRQPFVQGDVERFSWIEPGARLDVALTAEGRTAVPLPPAMRGANLVIEAVAPGLRRAITHYSHDLAVHLAHQYGQVRVQRGSTGAALPATYVKVYARQRGGAVAFYKDGYTDVRGRFDYVTLSTDDLDRVERFAILIASDDAGATVLEAGPPPR